MPGPFPGMDPYLENPAHWQGTHNALIVYMAEALNAVLPMPYAANVEARCYIGRPDNVARPDVTVRDPGLTLPSSRSGTAMADVSDPALLVHVYLEERNESYIEVVNIEGNQRVVTVLELLSHTNKTTRDMGRRLYREKQRQLLASDAHLIEIDLLRAGKHTVACPESALRPAHSFDYLACLHRAGRGMDFELWLNSLRRRLPRIAVPLDEDIPDVILDLQAVFDRNYDAGAYRRTVDYTRDPVPPLSPEDTEWSELLLKEHGIRS